MIQTILIKLSACITKRIQTIKHKKTVINKNLGFELNEIECLSNNLDKYLFDSQIQFPFSVTYDEYDKSKPKGVILINSPINSARLSEKSNNNEFIKISSSTKLLPFPKNLPSNHTSLTIYLDRINLKNAGLLIDPFICINIYNLSGLKLTQTQETSVALNKNDDLIIFNTEVHLQVSIENLYQNEHAIFIELYHYKPKKQKNSLKCFCIIEKDEIKEGFLSLEV